MADQVLYSGVASITELMTKDGLINLDFADVRAIMSEMGKAMMGTGEASGEKRAIEAAEAAISNPLLDDVSMRGARGLLISISGGPDLTLYEVDEAATRIREEVDPEANIILGATFDETLDGTMRVSVVATGLAIEADGELLDDEEAEEAEESIYGFAGSGPITPAPMAARPAPVAVAEQRPVREEAAEKVEVVDNEPELKPQPVVVAEHTEPVEDEVSAPDAYASDEEAELAAPAAPRINTQRSEAPRIPDPQEFPPIAQKQMAARDRDVAEIAENPHKKQRRSLLERLASVGLGRRDDPIRPEDLDRSSNEPRIVQKSDDAAGHAEHEDMTPDSKPADNVHKLSPQIDPELEDEDLEIPAFLRRQAN